MRSIRGMYTGKEIKPLEAINVRSNIHVIITFLEDEPVEIPENKTTEDGYAFQSPTPAYEAFFAT